MRKHLYVLDTCVLIHDSKALYKFKEHDVVIPLAVIDDLDELKAKPGVGWAAREAIRELDTLDLPALMSPKGVQVTPEKGSLFVVNLEAPPAAGESPNIVRLYSDNEIIRTALYLKGRNANRKVAIITKDAGLRIRAHAFGCLAENYRSDLLEGEMFTGMRTVEVASSAEYQRIWGQEEFEASILTKETQAKVVTIYPNEFCFFTLGDSQCVTMYQNGKFRILKDKGQKKATFMGIEPANIEQRCAMEALADPNIQLVTLCGPAGTGKTLLTLAVGLEYVNTEIYDRIIIMKPIIPVDGKDIGALPGSKLEKLSAWLGPIKDNVAQLVMKRGTMTDSPDELFESMVQDGIIEVEAMSYIQGRSIPKSLIIVDESENLRPSDARMVVERSGKGGKVVLLGDLSQVVNPYLDARSNGLAHAVNGGMFFDTCATVTLNKVERSELAAIASQIFNQPEAQRRR